jgi:hypothetical protein
MPKKKTRSKAKPKTSTSGMQDQGEEREAILDEREKLRRLFPSNYSPGIGVFSDGKVEVMLKLSYAQAEALARLMQEHKI